MNFKTIKLTHHLEINRQRLADSFKSMVAIDSVSKKERTFAAYLEKILASIGAEICFDDAGCKTGSDTGNLVAKFPGTLDRPPLLFSAHMDTVQPGEGIVPVLRNGTFTGSGNTILGADDKSAIAVLLEVMHLIMERKLDFGPLEFVFTICEEIGLQGAKNFDYSLVSANYGYVLDATDTEGMITRAPFNNRVDLTIYGRDAHGGAAPEKGINAISIAGKAMSRLKIGRIDRDTTCNIGRIEGGLARNIVPPKVTVHGEVRSHSEEKLGTITEGMVAAFQSAVDDYREHMPGNHLPKLETRVTRDYCGTHIPDDHRVVKLARQAAAKLGRRMKTKKTGGGSDANIFFEKGIVAGVIGTGMRDVHSVRENVSIEDMVKTAELVLEIIKVHADGH